MPSGFDPYHVWLGIPPDQQPPDHYRLLGLELYESNPSVIAMAADRQMSHLRKFAVGKHQEAAERLLNEIARSRVSLLNEDKKARYDAELSAVERAAAEQAAAKKAEEEAAGRASLASSSSTAAVAVLSVAPKISTQGSPTIAPPGGAPVVAARPARMPGGARSPRRPRSLPWEVAKIMIGGAIGLGGTYFLIQTYWPKPVPAVDPGTAVANHQPAPPRRDLESVDPSPSVAPSPPASDSSDAADSDDKSGADAANPSRGKSDRGGPTKSPNAPTKKSPTPPQSPDTSPKDASGKDDSGKDASPKDGSGKDAAPFDGLPLAVSLPKLDAEGPGETLLGTVSQRDWPFEIVFDDAMAPHPGALSLAEQTDGASHASASWTLAASSGGPTLATLLLQQGKLSLSIDSRWDETLAHQLYNSTLELKNSQARHRLQLREVLQQVPVPLDLTNNINRVELDIPALPSTAALKWRLTAIDPIVGVSASIEPADQALSVGQDARVKWGDNADTVVALHENAGRLQVVMRSFYWIEQAGGTRKQEPFSRDAFAKEFNQKGRNLAAMQAEFDGAKKTLEEVGKQVEAVNRRKTGTPKELAQKSLELNQLALLAQRAQAAMRRVSSAIPKQSVYVAQLTQVNELGLRLQKDAKLHLELFAEQGEQRIDLWRAGAGAPPATTNSASGSPTGGVFGPPELREMLLDNIWRIDWSGDEQQRNSYRNMAFGKNGSWSAFQQGNNLQGTWRAVGEEVEVQHASSNVRERFRFRGNDIVVQQAPSNVQGVAIREN